MEKFIVMWPHLGDRSYKAGDVRTAHAATVAHLVKNGTLMLKKDHDAMNKKKSDKPAPKNKAEPKPQNKAMTTAPKNKGASTVTSPTKPQRKTSGMFRKKG